MDWHFKAPSSAFAASGTHTILVGSVTAHLGGSASISRQADTSESTMAISDASMVHKRCLQKVRQARHSILWFLCPHDHNGIIDKASDVGCKDRRYSTRLKSYRRRLSELHKRHVSTTAPDFTSWSSSVRISSKSQPISLCSAIIRRDAEMPSTCISTSRCARGFTRKCPRGTSPIDHMNRVISCIIVGVSECQQLSSNDE